MTAVDIVLTIDEDADVATIRESIDSRLRPVDGVHDVSSTDSPTRDPTAIIAGVAVAVTLLRGTTGAVAEIRCLLREIKGLVNDIRGVSAAYIEVDGRTVPIDDIDDASIQLLAGEPAAPPTDD